MSGARPKRKGDRLERLVVTTLKVHGVPARRVPLSGSVRDYPSDVVTEILGQSLTIECKSRAEFKTLYGWLEDRDALVLRGDRRPPLVVMPLERFVDLLGVGGTRDYDQ